MKNESVEAQAQKHYKIGYVAGAFDMFHVGHLNLLRRAKERCDYLIAGVMSDDRVFELKKKYPVIPCNERMQVVAGCRYVDRVEELPVGNAGIMDAYNMFHYDCMFSGDDHAKDPVWLSEREQLRKLGSDIQFVSYTKETSSSEIRKKVEKDDRAVQPDDDRLLSVKNYRWIYTYDYAPDSVWEAWKSECNMVGNVPEWIADEANSVAERVRRKKADNMAVFLLIADSHFTYNGTWGDTVSSMRSLSTSLVDKGIKLDGIIHLGDLTDGLLSLERTQEIERMCINDMESVGVPIHFVPGNHDYNYFRGNLQITYPNKPQYYIDLHEQRIRLIFVDSFDPKETVRYGFTDYCVHWLEACLDQMPQEYISIIFSHVTPLVRLQAWTDNIRNRIKMVSVLDKYADRILAFINGHSHCDHLFNDLHNGQFPIISINCAKCEYFLDHKPKGAVVPFRRLGDRTQESFDIMQVDTKKREIYFTRFGAGGDRIVREHKAMWG